MIHRLPSHSSVVRPPNLCLLHVFPINLFIFFDNFTDDGHDKPKPREGKPPLPITEYKCLIRAQSKSKKLSTVVNQNEIMKFMEAYGKVMKTSMDGLKKVKKLKTKSKVAHG